MPRVILATGGTGGHLLPAQAVGEAMVDLGVEVMVTGASLVNNRCFYRRLPFQEIPASPLRMRHMVKDGWTLCKGVRESWGLMRAFAPDLVVGFGSFHTAPVLAAAKLCGRSIALVESNAAPGRVNRLFSRWAKLIAVSILQKDMPRSYKLVTLPERAKGRVGREAARRYFGLDPFTPTLLIFGGSLGACEINEHVVRAVGAYGRPLQVIHLAGQEERAVSLRARYEALGVLATVKSFEDNMALAWEAADFALCRAGGGTIAEIMEFEVPSLLLPYPYATEDHQRKNALYLETIGGGVCLSGVEALAGALQQMPEKLAGMQEAFSLFKKGHAPPSLVSVLMELLLATTRVSG